MSIPATFLLAILSIIDGKSNKQDAIFCDGNCNTWLHRRCAGLSQPAFQKLSNTDSSFFCPHCRLDRQESTIKDLLDTVKSLKEDISNINEKSCVHLSDQDSAPIKSFASVVQSSTHQRSVPSKPHFSSQERKFSLVIYGIS